MKPPISRLAALVSCSCLRLIFHLPDEFPKSGSGDRVTARIDTKPSCFSTPDHRITAGLTAGLTVRGAEEPNGKEFIPTATTGKKGGPESKTPAHRGTPGQHSVPTPVRCALEDTGCGESGGRQSLSPLPSTVWLSCRGAPDGPPGSQRLHCHGDTGSPSWQGPRHLGSSSSRKAWSLQEARTMHAHKRPHTGQ